MLRLDSDSTECVATYQLLFEFTEESYLSLRGSIEDILWRRKMDSKKLGFFSRSSFCLFNIPVYLQMIIYNEYACTHVDIDMYNK